MRIDIFGCLAMCDLGSHQKARLYDWRVVNAMLIRHRVISDIKDFTILKSMMDVNFDLRRQPIWG